MFVLSINSVHIYLYPDPKEIRTLTFSISRFYTYKRQLARVKFFEKKKIDY